MLFFYAWNLEQKITFKNDKLQNSNLITTFGFRKLIQTFLFVLELKKVDYSE